MVCGLCEYRAIFACWSEYGSRGGTEVFAVIVVEGEDSAAVIQAQEDARADAALSGWKLTGYDASGWQAAVPKLIFDMPFAEAPANQVDSMIPRQRHENRRFKEVVTVRDSGAETKDVLKEKYNILFAKKSPVVVPAHTTHIVEISAGTEKCGYLKYAFAGGRGAKVTTLCAESYVYPQPPQVNADGQTYQPEPKKGDRTDFVHGKLLGQSSYYTVGGYGTKDMPECYEPYWFRTFRFIQLKIETADETLELIDFSYISTGYPLDVKTRFKSSDQSLADIWDISIRTLKRCMHETYFDCPFYEQLQYAMDSRSEILYTYAISGDDRLARQAMEAFRRSQRPDGMINACAPSPNGGVIPGFAIYYILMVYDHMMYFGDRKLVKKHMSAIEGVLAFFEKHLTADGIVDKVGDALFVHKYWSFIDWSEQWNSNGGMPLASALGTGALTMESLLYLYGLQKSARLAAFIDRPDLQKEYEESAQKLGSAIKNVCSGKTVQSGGQSCRLLQDGPGVEIYSVHSQVFAVLTGLMTPAEGRSALEVTLDDETYAQPSVAFMFYLFRALEICDMYERTDALWDVWRQMLADNLTTCMESNRNPRSDCHAWASLLCYEMPSVILGVRPAAPGFAKAAILPHAGKLAYASGDVITPKGYVHVDWKKNADGTLTLNYNLPEGLELTEQISE